MLVKLPADAHLSTKLYSRCSFNSKIVLEMLLKMHLQDTNNAYHKKIDQHFVFGLKLSSYF